jgi:general secretion pathway protein N
MPGRKSLIAAGAAALLLGVVVLFPARVAYRWFAPPDLQLSGLSGTLWHGQAAEGSAAGVYLGQLQWRFRPWSLLLGKAAFSLAADPVSGFLETGLAVGAGGHVSFSSLDAALPLRALDKVLPVRGIEGSITLKFDSLVLEDGVPVEADGTLVLANLVVRTLSQAPLGDYRVVFQTGGNGIGGQLEEVSGVVDIAGTILLRRDRGYSITGQIAAMEGAPAAIGQQLQFLGSPDAQGRRSFRFEGQLAAPAMRASAGEKTD